MQLICAEATQLLDLEAPHIMVKHSPTNLPIDDQYIYIIEVYILSSFTA